MNRRLALVALLLLPFALSGCAVSNGPNAWQMIAWCILRGEFC